MSETPNTITIWRVDFNGLLLEGPVEIEKPPFLRDFETKIAPPEAGENQVAKFDKKTGLWNVVHDFRGTQYWLPDGTPMTIAQVGINLPADAIMSAPPTSFHKSYDSVAKTWLLDRDALKEYLLQRVEIEKHESQLAGCTIDGVLWDTDDKAEVRYTQFLVMFTNDPALEIPDFYPNADNHFTLTAAIFSPAYQAMLHQVQSIFAWRTAKRAEIEAAATDDAMLALMDTVSYPFSQYNADGTVVV